MEALDEAPVQGLDKGKDRALSPDLLRDVELDALEAAMDFGDDDRPVVPMPASDAEDLAGDETEDDELEYVAVPEGPDVIDLTNDGSTAEDDVLLMTHAERRIPLGPTGGSTRGPSAASSTAVKVEVDTLIVGQGEGPSGTSSDEDAGAIAVNSVLRARNPPAPALDLDDEVTCTICWHAFIAPTSLPCGHAFCSPCILDWLKKERLCPACREPYHGDPLKTAKNFVLEPIVNKYVEHSIARMRAEGNENEALATEMERQDRLEDWERQRQQRRDEEAAAALQARENPRRLLPIEARLRLAARRMAAPLHLHDQRPGAPERELLGHRPDRYEALVAPGGALADYFAHVAAAPPGAHPPPLRPLAPRAPAPAGRGLPGRPAAAAPPVRPEALAPPARPVPVPPARPVAPAPAAVPHHDAERQRVLRDLQLRVAQLEAELRRGEPHAEADARHLVDMAGGPPEAAIFHRRVLNGDAFVRWLDDPGRAALEGRARARADLARQVQEERRRRIAQERAERRAERQWNLPAYDADPLAAAERRRDLRALNRRRDRANELEELFPRRQDPPARRNPQVATIDLTDEPALDDPADADQPAPGTPAANPPRARVAAPRTDPAPSREATMRALSPVRPPLASSTVSAGTRERVRTMLGAPAQARTSVGPAIGQRPPANFGDPYALGGALFARSAALGDALATHAPLNAGHQSTSTNPAPTNQPAQAGGSVGDASEASAFRLHPRNRSAPQPLPATGARPTSANRFEVGPIPPYRRLPERRFEVPPIPPFRGRRLSSSSDGGDERPPKKPRQP